MTKIYNKLAETSIDYIIKCNNITKVYKNKFTSLDNVSLNIKSESITGLIGQNGAGKTTLIKILCYLLNQTEGKITILGKELNHINKDFIKHNIGYVGEDINLFQHLYLEEFWNLVGSIYGLNKLDIKKRTTELIEVLGLENSKGKLIKEFSKGMKKKCLIGAAIIHDPKILILDEPLEGIDPISRKVIKDLLKNLQEDGTTIFLTSHDLLLVEDICTDIIIIDNGVIKYSGNKKDLLSLYNNDNLEDIFIRIINNNKKLSNNLSWRHKSNE